MAFHDTRNAKHVFYVSNQCFYEPLIVYVFTMRKTNENNFIGEEKMRIKSLAIASVMVSLFGGFAFAQQSTTSLKVNVEGIESNQGQILATLCKKEEFLKSKCEYSGAIKLENNSEHVMVFENVKTGEYALQLFHDLNSDYKLQTNLMGIPTEPFAFSNNAKGSFGPPKFEQAAFEIKPGTEITVTFEQ